MKLTYEIKTIPSTTCFVAFSNEHKIIEGLKSGVCEITVEKYTKTSLIVSIKAQRASGTIAYIPKGAENLKYHHTERYNPFSSELMVNDYIKVTKKQGALEFRQYLKCFFEQLNLNIPELSVEMYMEQSVLENFNVSEGTCWVDCID